MKICIFISGAGTNMAAIKESIEQSGSDIKITSVVCDKENAKGLLAAKDWGINTHLVLKKNSHTRESFDQKLDKIITDEKPDYIVLAGFMRILSDWFVKKHFGKIINVHPSLLPKYKGLHTHQRVIENRDSSHGSSVHLVSCELDAGPLIAQQAIDVRMGDNEESLMDKIKKVEHVLYPWVIHQLAEGALAVVDKSIFYRGEKLDKAGIFFAPGVVLEL